MFICILPMQQRGGNLSLILGSTKNGPVVRVEGWLSKKKSEWPKMQLVDHPPTIMPEMKIGKKQETVFTAYMLLQTNHRRLEIGSKALLQLELISPCLCKSEGELFSTCQESKKGRSTKCCYSMKSEKLRMR